MKFSEYRALIDEGGDIQLGRSGVPKEARAMQGQRAGLITRALAVGLDIALVTVMVLVINGIVAFVRYLIREASGAVLPQLFASVAVGGFLLWLLWTVSWVTTGRSFGQYLLGLRVVNYAGERVNLATSALRSVFCVGFPIGLLWTLVSHQNRSLQDIVLRTNVINDWVVGLPSLRGSATKSS